MPTYQYACTECDHAFEQVQSFTDDALKECPRCAGRLRKIFNAVGVVFKGSGFYRTDSRADATSGKTDGGSANGSNGSKPNGSNGSKSGSESSTSQSGSGNSTKAPAAAGAA